MKLAIVAIEAPDSERSEESPSQARGGSFVVFATQDQGPGK